MNKTEIPLIENAMDFVSEAVIRLAKPNPDLREIKYVILHLSSGLELLQKQFLVDKDFSLIFKKYRLCDNVKI